MDGTVERGVATVNAMMGAGFGERIQAMAESGNFGAPLADLALKFAFGEVWSREGPLTQRERSIAVIASLVTQRQTAELKNHVRIGLNHGLLPAEIEDILVVLAPYLGFPAVAVATDAAIEVLREVGEGDTNTATELGLR